jgi:outer membrane lipoprotein-sorting protein
MANSFMLKSKIAGLAGAVMLLASLLSVTSAFANTNSAQLLRKMTEAIKQNQAVELKFEMVATIAGSGTPDAFRGTVQAQGNAFRLINPHVELFCDGKSKWILNVDADELTIFVNDTTQKDLVENPVGFLTSLAGADSGYKFPDKPKDGPVWLIELTPVSKRTAYKNVIVGINKITNLPVSIEYNGKDGSNYKVVITSFRSVPAWPLSNFVFPDSKISGLTVTDLR